MFRLISIKNFQSHKDTTLELSSGVNTIIGPSDSGKTAILRAFADWLVNNRPLGKAFQSTWGKLTEVRAETTNKKVVIRTKSPNKNHYKLSGLKDPLEGFGSNVPEEISKTLNILPINIHRQHDGPFLLSKSPPEIARYLNTIVGLDKIDIALKNIASTLREEKGDLVKDETEKIILIDELESLRWLSKAEGELVVLEQLDMETKHILAEINKIIDISKTIIEIDDKINKAKSILKYKKAVDNLTKEQDNLKILNKKLDSLHLITQEIINKEDKLRYKEQLLSKTKKTFKKEMPNVCPLCEQVIKC